MKAMFGKKKLAVGLTAVVALTTLAGAGVASAHGGGPGGEYADSIRERAAGILGIDPTDLQEAMQTAREEAARERLVERLNTAVEDGTITAEERDAILDWIDAKPDVVDEIGHGRHYGILPLHADGLAARLNALVEAGTITQELADEVTAWVASAPEALSQVMPDRGRFGGRHGRHGHGPWFRYLPVPAGGDTESESGFHAAATTFGTAA